MKIHTINNLYNYHNQYSHDKPNVNDNILPLICHQYNKNNLSCINYAAYNNISFGKKDHLNLSNLLNSGYELIQQNTDGEIINSGKNIILKDSKDLVALSKTEKAWKKNYILVSDIDMKGQDFQGIGNLKRYYSGVFDGNGFAIKNLVIKKDNSNTVGLFRACDNAEIKNLEIKNALVRGKSDVGGIVGLAENNTILSNIVFDGTVTGANVVGGLVGYSKHSNVDNCLFSGKVQFDSKNNLQNEDDDFFVSEKQNDVIAAFIGGIFGIGENSVLSASGINAQISGKSTVGGLVGLADWCDIHDCVLTGDVTGKEKTGVFVGLAQNSKISNSYSLTSNPLIGESFDTETSKCFSQISSLNDNIHSSWNSNIWNILPKKLPRLKSQLTNFNPTSVFLEDVNNDIKNGNIQIGMNYTPPKTISVKLEDMNPPAHYTENEQILSEINSCTDSSKLAKLFACWTDNSRRGFNAEDKKHDEILLALIKNKHLNMNERWNSNSAFTRYVFTGQFEEATYCTPLYVLSALNKGYVFKEALKRTDINPFLKSGPSETSDIFQALYKKPISTNMFLLFNSKNPKVQEYIKQSLTQLPSYPSEDKLTNLLCSKPINTFNYNESTKEINIPIYLLNELESLKEIRIKGKDNYSSLADIVSSPDIDGSYTDSQGNNILHLISEKDFSAIEQLTYSYIAIKKGANLNMKNRNRYTPYMLAIKNKNDLLCCKMLEHNISDKFYTDDEGNNALFISTKYNETKQAILIMDNLHKMGFSLNVRNNEQSTPLIEAVKNNDMKKLNYLLTNGAAVDLCDENGHTALHHAFMNQNVSAIKWLMDSYACLEIKDKLGLKPKDYWNDCNSNEDFARINWDVSILEYNFAGINDSDSSSFNITDFSNLQIDMNKMKDFNINDLTAKGSLLEKSLIKLYYCLCIPKNKINSNTTNKSTIFEKVVQTNNPYSKECIIKMLKYTEIDINKQNEYGETPLLLALKSYQNAKTSKEKLSCMQNIKCLLDNNANIDIADANGQTALHYAVFSNNIMLFNELLGKHPNVNYTDILGKNPIQYLNNDPEDPMRKIYNIYAQKRDLNK